MRASERQAAAAWGEAIEAGGAEEVLAAVFAQDAVGIAVVESATGRVLRANGRYGAITGHAPAALAATTTFRLTHDADLDAYADRVREIVMGRAVEASGEVRRLRPDGTAVPVCLALAPVPGADGTPGRHLEIVVDLTMRHAAEAYLRAIIGTAPVCVKLLGPDAELIDMNPEGLRMIEADSLEEVRGVRVADLVLDADRDSFVRAVAEAREGRLASVRFRIRGRAGTVRWMESRIVPFHCQEGLGAGAVALAVTRDVTDSHRAERALERSQARLGAAMRAARLGVFEVEVDSRRTHWSPELVGMFDAAPARPLPSPAWFADRLHPADWDVLRRAYERTVETGERSRERFRLRRDDETMVHCETVMERVEDEDGVRIVGIVQDVTEQVGAEAALQESRARLAGLLDALDDVVWSAEPVEFRLTFVSDAAARLFGWSADELLADPSLLGRTIHPLDAGALDAGRAALAREDAMDVEYRIVRKDGGIRWVRNRARVVRDGDGRPVRIDGLITDLTEEREAIDALRASERRFRRLLERSWDVTVLTDAEGTILYASDSITRVLGRRVADYLGRRAVEFLPPEGRTAEAADRPRVLESRGQPCVFEYEAAHADGSIRVLDVVATNCLDDPAVGAIVVNVRDVTERRQAEQQLRDLMLSLEARVRERTEELEGANAELEAFSYTVSHDLRAPLRAIDGFTHMLTEEEGERLSPGARHCLERIRESTRRMARLIEDLLRFSRLGRQPLERGIVDMARIVADAWEQLAPERAGRRVEFRVGPLPPCYGDATLLGQVVLNLLSNALKFTRERDVAEIEVGYADGYYVRDNGVGFEEGYAERLFDVFQRLHGEAYDGTGVGLAIVARIVNRHGGAIRAEGRPGAGARFAFTLPPAVSATAGV